MPQKRKKAYDRFKSELSTTTNNYLLKDAYVQEMLKTTIANIRQNLPNLVSFVDSLVDQTPWERASNVTTPSEDSHGPYVEASLQ